MDNLEPFDLGGGRTAVRLTCWLCSSPAVYTVTDETSYNFANPEVLNTCETHLLSAFS